MTSRNKLRWKGQAAQTRMKSGLFLVVHIASSAYFAAFFSPWWINLEPSPDCHFSRCQSMPADVKSWTTFFTNKFEKSKKISPTRLSVGIEPLWALYGTMMNLCNEYSYLGAEDLFGLMLEWFWWDFNKFSIYAETDKQVHKRRRSRNNKKLKWWE